jgi:hypothetical protein
MGIETTLAECVRDVLLILVGRLGWTRLVGFDMGRFGRLELHDDRPL